MKLTAAITQGVLLASLITPAPAEVTSQEPLVTEQLPRPAHIWVHDFAATGGDMPADADPAGQHKDDDTPQTEAEIAEGRMLGALTATELVSQLREMGMPAEHVTAETKQEVNDLVLRGYLVSYDEGDPKKRVLIGLGKGESELHAVVEGYQVTKDGLRKLGSGTTDTHSKKTPGTAVGVVGLLATKNPVGLVVSTGMKVHGEKTGKSTVEGRAKATGQEIAKALREQFAAQGWIEKSDDTGLGHRLRR